jgi:hypothetical protein
MYLWRAVDHEGEIFDMLVQRSGRVAAAPPQLIVSQQSAFRDEALGHVSYSRSGAAAVEKGRENAVAVKRARLVSVVSLTRDRGFESCSLRRRVDCEPGFPSSGGRDIHLTTEDVAVLDYDIVQRLGQRAGG